MADKIMILLLAPCLVVLALQVVYDRVTRRDARREWEDTHEGLQWKDWH
jgi:hypothetical protein